jgi:hypothetical protein
MTNKWEAATLIGVEGYALVRELHEKDLPKLKSGWRALFRANAPTAVGLISVDVSLNLNAGTGGENHWQIHLHCIVANIKNREWDKIRQALAANGGGRRLFIEPATNPIGQLAYMAKPNFFRRVSIRDRRGKLNTRIEPLSALEELELAKWLSPHRVTSRFIKLGSVGDTLCK